MPPTAVHSPFAAPSSSEFAASDRSLVALAARGDQSAFEVLFQRHRPGVHAYAVRMLTDHAAAEDVVQEVFFSAMRSLRNGTKPVHVRAWLQEIARHACVDHWRGSERRREVSYDAPDSLSGKDARQMAISGDVAMRGADDRESLACLQSAFEDLPPLQHSVLVQRELEGRSSNEIAERLGISPTVVEGQLARGRRSLAVSYRELQSGERCVATRDLCEASLDRSLGVRERARVRVHLRTCGNCRRHARATGVEPRLFDPRVLGQLGFLLPLPLLRRFPLNSLFASSESLGAAIAGKALVGAAVIAAGGGSALVMSDIGPERGADPAPVVREAGDAPTTFAVGGTPRVASSTPASAVLAPASLAPAAAGGPPEIRLAFASAATDQAPAESTRGDDPAAREPHAPGEPDGAAVVPGPGRTGALETPQTTPFTLPRFVPSAPPRVQRLDPVPQAPAPGGTTGTDRPVEIPGDSYAGRNGRQLPVPDTKVGTGPTKPEPVPEPKPDPGPGDGSPVPVPGEGSEPPVEPETPPVEPETPPVEPETPVGGEPSAPDAGAPTDPDPVAPDAGSDAAADPAPGDGL